MITASLRWRLLAGAIAAILLALCVAWLFMVLLFERHLERRLQAEMTRDALQLVATLSFAPDGRLQAGDTPGDARLRQPASGYYWQVATAAGVLRSRSLWDSALPVPRDSPGNAWRLRRLQAGPFGQRVVVLERRLKVESDQPPVVVQFAQDTDAIATARSEFARELLVFLAALWVVLSTAAWLQVTLGLRPLARIRDDLAALERNAGERLPPGHLREVRPLVDAINALAEARARELERARHRAADLAHRLKTPLAAMAALSRRAREAGAKPAADGMDRAVAAIARVVDAELAQARLARAGQFRGDCANVRDVVERLVTVIEHTDKGGELAFDIDVPAGLQLAVHADDLSEILGAVLENAARHARRQVRIVGHAGPQWTSLTIEDDGPGFAPDRIGQVLVRGVRFDESAQGSGLGLSIARELTEATGGRLSLSAATLGGAAVRFHWDG